MSDIFISYKREEQDAARQLADHFQTLGWDVWWDPKLRAGEHYDDVIEEALKSSRCIVVLWSLVAIRSRYVKDEANQALKSNKLIPVLLDDCEPPFRFQGIHTIDLSHWDGTMADVAFQELASDIAAAIGEPAGFNLPPATGVPSSGKRRKRHWFQRRRYLALVTTIVVMATVALALWWSQAPRAEELCEIQLEQPGARARITALEARPDRLSAGREIASDAMRSQRVPLSPSGRSTIVLPHGKQRWHVVVIWAGDEESIVKSIMGCPAGKTLTSSDGKVRIEFRRL